jgi:hypothetical protein
MSEIVDLSLSEDEASVSPTFVENNRNFHSKIYRGRSRVIRVRISSPSNATTTLPSSQPLGEVGVGNIDLKSITIVKDIDDDDLSGLSPPTFEYRLNKLQNRNRRKKQKILETSNSMIIETGESVANQIYQLPDSSSIRTTSLEEEARREQQKQIQCTGSSSKLRLFCICIVLHSIHFSNI